METMFKDHSVILFAPEFKPYPGGVSEYTSQLMKVFYQARKLNKVITHQFQEDDFHGYIDFLGFDWREEKRTRYPRLVSKTVSLFYNLILRIYYLRKIFSLCFSSKSNEVIINSLFSRLSWWAIFWFKLFGVKYLLLIHGLDLIEQSKKNNGRLQAALLHAGRCIVNSNATKDLLKKYAEHELEEKILVYYPPFCANDFDSLICGKYLFDLVDVSNKKIISTVCRLVERKGIDYAVRALIPLLHNNPEWVYLIAGEGECQPKIIELIKESGLQKQIVLLGAISDQDKYALLKKSEIFVMPNHSLNDKDIEGFGISFVEAQYFGNAIIGGASGGSVESVNDGETGFLVPFTSDFVQEIRAKALFLMENDSIRKNMQQVAKEFVVKEFELSQLVKKVSG